MDEKRCGTCRWFRRPENIYDNADFTYGICKKIVLNTQLNVCSAPHVEAFVQDWECFQADLYCLRTFGCVLWEPKEAANA